MLSAFKSLSISQKIFTGVVTISIVGVIIGIVGLTSIHFINSRLNDITDQAAPTVETADDLVAGIWEANKVAEEIIADEEISDVNELAKELKVLEAAFLETYKEIQILVTDPDLLDELDRASKEHSEFVVNTDKMIAAHLAELQEEIKADELLDEFDNIGGQLVTMLDEFAIENEEEMQKAEDLGDRLEASGRSSVREVNAILGDLFDTDYPAVESALKMQRLIIEMQDTAGEYLASEDPNELPLIAETFNGLAAQVRPHIETLTRLAESDEDKQDAKALATLFNTWYSTADDEERLFDTHSDMLRAEYEADTLVEALESDADRVAAALNVVADKADAISDSADEAAATVVLTAQVLTGGTLLLLLLGAYAITQLVKTMISGPILTLNETMLKLADGDTSVVVPAQDQQDEVGDMARAVEVFKTSAIERERLEAEQKQREASELKAAEEAQRMEERRKEAAAQEAEERQKQRQEEMRNLADQFEKQVLAVVDKVAGEVDEMSAAVREMGNVAEQTSSESSNVTRIAEGTSSNVQTMASSAEELSASISEISNQAESAGGITSSAVSRTENASQDVDELVEFAERISNVVGLINDIAEQTNLLALNATIEAARAGDAGRGFAVVASEVKSLAAQTGKATEDISSQISAMQGIAGQARQGMETVQTDIQQINDAIGQMVSSITQQNSATQEIARSAQEVSQGTNEVTSSIASVNEGASTTGSSVERVVSSLQSVSQETSVLRDEAVGFIKRIRNS